MVQFKRLAGARAKTRPDPALLKLKLSYTQGESFKQNVALVTCCLPLLVHYGRVDEIEIRRLNTYLDRIRNYPNPLKQTALAALFNAIEVKNMALTDMDLSRMWRLWEQHLSVFFPKAEDLIRSPDGNRQIQVGDRVYQFIKAFQGRKELGHTDSCRVRVLYCETDEQYYAVKKMGPLDWRGYFGIWHEWKTMQKLAGMPGILPVVDVFLYNGSDRKTPRRSVAIVMPIGGQTLYDLQNELNTKQKLLYFWQIAQILAAAKKTSGSAHGDLKSTNVLVDDAGCVSVIDWALSRRPDPDEDKATLLRDLILAGGTYYNPPSVRYWESGGRTEVDPYALDVFAFGVMLVWAFQEVWGWVNYPNLAPDNILSPDVIARKKAVLEYFLNSVRQKVPILTQEPRLLCGDIADIVIGCLGIGDGPQWTIEAVSNQLQRLCDRICPSADSHTG